MPALHHSPATLSSDCKCLSRRRGIDHHWRDDVFATAGAKVDVWSHERSEPVSTFTWGADTIHSVRFNPVSNLI